jgi:hypothetical protein
MDMYIIMERILVHVHYSVVNLTFLFILFFLNIVFILGSNAAVLLAEICIQCTNQS